MYFNILSMFSRKSKPIIKHVEQDVCKTQFEKEIKTLMQKSDEALQEIRNENFNSETLKTLLSPNFKTKKNNCLMAISTKVPNSPVEVSYDMKLDKDIVTLNIFPNESQDILLGSKTYFLERGEDGIFHMFSGSMSSDEELCKKIGVKGIGMLERILQINDAIKMNISSIPCISYARSVLFHLKMGFMPVQHLEQINSLSDIKKIMDNLKNRSVLDVFAENYTPIIVKKGDNYYLDSNTTQCVANLRQIKNNYKKFPDRGPRPFIRGTCVDMILEGSNYNIWKDMIATIF